LPDRSKLSREQKLAALANLEKKLQADASVSLALLTERALLNYSLGNFASSSGDLNKLLSQPKVSGHRTLLKLRGLCLENLHQYGQALKQYDDALLIAPFDIQCLKARARVYGQLNQGARARADLEKALSASTGAKASEISLLLAKALFQQNHQKQAIKLLQDNWQSALKITSGDEVPSSSPLASLDLLASFLVIEGDYGGALRALNVEMKLESENLQSNYSAVWQKQAWLLAATGQGKQSDETLASLATLTKKMSTRLSKKFDQDWHDWQKLADLFKRLKRPQEEKDCLQQIIKLTRKETQAEQELNLNTPDLDALTALIQAYEASGDSGSARAVQKIFYRKVEEMAKLYGDPAYHFKWAEELARQGKVAEALTHFKIASAAAPENIQYRRRCVEILLTQKEFEQALSFATAPEASDASFLALAASAQRELGDLAGVQAKLQTALSLDCLEPLIYQELAKEDASKGKEVISKRKNTAAYLQIR